MGGTSGQRSGDTLKGKGVFERVCKTVACESPPAGPREQDACRRGVVPGHLCGGRVRAGSQGSKPVRVTAAVTEKGPMAWLASISQEPELEFALST